MFMKNLVIATLCTSVLLLTACAKPSEKQTAEQTQQVTYSQNNVEHIKADLSTVETLSNKKAEEGLEFQNEAVKASQSGKDEDIQAVVNKMKTFVDGFNQELTALKLQSSEVNELRGKMIESNNLGLQLAQEGSSKAPNEQKIQQLQTQVTTTQEQMLDIMQKLQAKVGRTSPATASQPVASEPKVAAKS